MASIDSLPTELLLRILSFLSLQNLRNVRLIARRWEEFVLANQTTIYHHAALFHNFVNSLDVLLPEAKEAQNLHFLRDVPDWYQYCGPYRCVRDSLSLKLLFRPEILSASEELDGSWRCDDENLWQIPLRHPSHQSRRTTRTRDHDARVRRPHCLRHGVVRNPVETRHRTSSPAVHHRYPLTGMMRPGRRSPARPLRVRERLPDLR